MSIVSLSRDGEDLRKRVLRVCVGKEKGRKRCVFLKDLRVAPGVFSLLEKTLYPNLVSNKLYGV